MNKHVIVFFLLLTLTITNTLYFGIKDAREQEPEHAQKQIKKTITEQKIIVEKSEPVNLRVWKEYEYPDSAYTIAERPVEKKPVKASIASKASSASITTSAPKESLISKGIKYVKIPFKGKYIYVSSDYYAVDGVRKPLSFKEAQKVARAHGAVLPTKEMVDAIWKHADLKLQPHPLKAGPLMTQPVYYFKHNDIIEKQIKARPFDLVAGHKKDIIRARRKGRVTIYGWHRLNGKPIQPPSNVHDDDYDDYSNCLRLVKLHS